MTIEILTMLLQTTTVVTEPTAHISSMSSHSDVLAYVVGILLTIIGFYTARTLRQVDQNMQSLFTRMNELSKEFYELRGEHIAKLGDSDHR